MTVPNKQTDRWNRGTAPAWTEGTDGRADRLFYLAGQVARLSPDRRNPEAFHVLKSEIIHALRRMAMEAGR